MPLFGCTGIVLPVEELSFIGSGSGRAGGEVDGSAVEAVLAARVRLLSGSSIAAMSIFEFRKERGGEAEPEPEERPSIAANISSIAPPIPLSDPVPVAAPDPVPTRDGICFCRAAISREGEFATCAPGEAKRDVLPAGAVETPFVPGSRAESSKAENSSPTGSEVVDRKNPSRRSACGAGDVVLNGLRW